MRRSPPRSHSGTLARPAIDGSTWSTTVFSQTRRFPNAHRVYTYLTMAVYDATIAAWESKYFYNRPRPSEVDTTLPTALPTPRSPAYPSEHAAAAGAAATVLAYFFPDEALSFQAMAEEAAQSRVLAGVQFPSDSSAGLELGRRVAEQVIARAKVDGSDAVWTGTVPTGPCMWVGDKPANATMPNWKPILLETADEFRPPTPPDCKSAAVKAETDAVRQFERKFPNSYKAFYWQSPSGLFTDWYDYASKWMFEDKTDSNPPRAARAYAMLATVYYDAYIASNDGKYAYWYLRPNMLDPSITPLFAVPAHPSYPSNHSTLSTARCEVLAYLFPDQAEFIRTVGKEAGDSASGPASTMKWTTGPVPHLAKQSPGNSSSGQKKTGQTSGRAASLSPEMSQS